MLKRKVSLSLWLLCCSGNAIIAPWIVLLFSMALGPQSPWQVNDISFSDDGCTRKELHLHIEFWPRLTFSRWDRCRLSSAWHRDTWVAALNFFEQLFFCMCCAEDKTTDGKSGDGWCAVVSPLAVVLILLFEAFAMALIEREMPVNRVAEVLGVNPQRVWTLFNHWISQAREADDLSPLTWRGRDLIT